MKCIFCGLSSDNSASVEHIVPESLGNKSTILPKGVVCDNCNNYFAIKIENELLNYPYFRSVRQRNFIISKKGNFVSDRVFFPGSETGWANVRYHKSMYRNGKNIIQLSFDNPSEEILKYISQNKEKRLFSILYSEPEHDNIIVSRFLAKCAIEYLAKSVMIAEGWYNFVRNDNFMSLIKYARYGEGKFWPYSQRRVYGEGTGFLNTLKNETYEILNEMDFFILDENLNRIQDCSNSEGFTAEIYFVLTIMGIEYAINLGGREIHRYKEWYQKNNYKSPLERDYEINQGSSNQIFPFIIDF